ncbi:AAA family ATPase [Methylobacterium gossipiicola]|uniref:Bifunctional DNA primase/polymerase, N-terminal n=1 Tax=Methylobacterium gossipiicola TaxID=582675 RepID=A0A1I2X6W3_9HYPH|nr:AAA family ATPase [Methylobacterium gossipiicola]SFH08709.1 Bifunctional DNA primase/polymerase, N-terminal [Methylobacterium gossipiicola]
MSASPAETVNLQDVAAGLAEQGFRVFPLIPGGKTPAVEDFPNAATPDPDRALAWWSPVLGDPDERNVGVATGRGLVVIDYDMKPGQDGARSLFNHEMRGLPTTLTVRTPTGGIHKYLRTDPELRLANSVGKIAPNTDVRAENGYVVAPGSVTEKGAYVVIDDSPIADAPEWLIAECGAARVRAADVQDLVELDTEGAISRATDYLKHHAEPSYKGSGGDLAAFKAACGARDFGIYEVTCLELMLEHWNDRGVPSWSPERLQEKVEHAYRYALNPAGVASADAEFGELPPLPLGEGSDAQAGKFELLDFNDSADRAETAAAEPLIEGLMDRWAMSVLYGASNEGKTFVMMDLAYHIAMGRRWNGRAVKRGPVVYVVAEGGNQIHKRTAALRERYGAEGALFDLIVAPVNLLRSDADLKDLILALKAAAAKRGAPVELVVVDTLSRALAGGDENSSVDMGAIVRNLDRLRAASGAHLAVVHHTGKDAARGARGHSLLRAATDTELEVAGGRLITRKQRDTEERVNLGFRLDSIKVGQDCEGHSIKGATCEWEPVSEFSALPITGAEAEALAGFETWRGESIRRAALEGASGHPITFRTSEVLAFFTDSSREGAKVSESTIKRWLGQWDQSGMVRKEKRGQWVVAEGSKGSTNGHMASDPSGSVRFNGPTH